MKDMHARSHERHGTEQADCSAFGESSARGFMETLGCGCQVRSLSLNCLNTSFRVVSCIELSIVLASLLLKELPLKLTH